VRGHRVSHCEWRGPERVRFPSFLLGTRHLFYFFRFFACCSLLLATSIHAPLCQGLAVIRNATHTATYHTRTEPQNSRLTRHDVIHAIRWFSSSYNSCLAQNLASFIFCCGTCIFAVRRRGVSVRRGYSTARVWSWWWWFCGKSLLYSNLGRRPS
jgi:hypothetical protein